MKYTLYEVGGRIRDQLLGLQSKDIDYSVVLDDPTKWDVNTVTRKFAEHLETQGYEIFLVTENCYTVRALFPDDHTHSGVADFVIARKEVGYVEGTRTPIVELGTLRDDLERRDFTVNAMAKAEDGEIIDLFGGMEDLANRILQTPIDAHVTFNDDPLRILRALRFACTKEFELSDEIEDAIKDYNGDFSVISTERVYSELNKMFNHNTYDTLWWLECLQMWNFEIYKQLFPKGWKLQMTNKK
jgi:tRNA nucleotidyltransferase/poly(A) polymerase